MEKDKSENSGRKFFIYLLLFFVTFASVDAFFVYKAVTTHTGEIEQIHGK